MSDEIVRRVASCVGQVLALSKDEVRPESRLIDELGADSLDLVELMFVLEQEFHITLNERDMSLSAQLGLPDSEIHHEEVLTPRALELLRARYPAAQEILADGATRRSLAKLVTVEEVARTVERKLSAPKA